MAAIPVNVDNFARAETDRMFAAIQRDAGRPSTTLRAPQSPVRRSSSSREAWGGSSAPSDVATRSIPCAT